MHAPHLEFMTLTNMRKKAVYEVNSDFRMFVELREPDRAEQFVYHTKSVLFILDGQ